jgi:hypothetical protein
MAKKLYRMIKSENGKVIDHRPVDHPDIQTGEWKKKKIPENLPATLNEMMARGALSDDMTWPDDWETSCPLPGAKSLATRLANLLIKKGVITQADLDAEA